MKIFEKPALGLLFVCGMVLFCYWPGLSGGFLFDDFHNLDRLGTNGQVADWETFRAYILSGISGPTGRPLSLLSFLLNDNTWPSVARDFKLTNLWIHLLCGLLLCWVNLFIFRLLKFSEMKAQWAAVFSAACWMLSPLFVSTTLYVVQRMAQLSTLFVLAGLLGYLHGRGLIEKARAKAHIWMSFSLVLGTVLAVLSKENGALLPLLVLTLEFCLARHFSVPKPMMWWRACFLWCPSLVLVGYLVTLVNFSPDAWPGRNFDQPERLLTESRIVWEYLRCLFLPKIEGMGLFQDGYVVSHGLFFPWTTFPSVLGILCLVCLGVFARKNYPLVSFGILFYCVGHILESTVAGLELYFEHRNYMAALFLFFPLLYCLDCLKKRFSIELACSLASLFLIVLTFFLWQRCMLWSDTSKLQLYWSAANPNSARAQNALASYFFSRGMYSESEAVLSQAEKQIPDSALLNLAMLMNKVQRKQADIDDFKKTAAVIKKQQFDAQAILSAREIVDFVVSPAVSSEYAKMSMLVLEGMNENVSYHKIPVFNRAYLYMQGRLYIKLGFKDDACVSFRRAIPAYDDVDSSLMMVAEAATAGYRECAMELLDMSTDVLKRKKDFQLNRSKESYAKDISYLRSVIKTD